MATLYWAIRYTSPDLPVAQSFVTKSRASAIAEVRRLEGQGSRIRGVHRTPLAFAPEKG